MLDRELLSKLEALAEQLEIPVRYANLATEELAGREGYVSSVGSGRSSSSGRSAFETKHVCSPQA